MSERPSMQARDSSGKNVSLLNPEPNQRSSFSAPLTNRTVPPAQLSMLRTHSNDSTHSSIASPKMPELMRANSFDSQNTLESASPVTPYSLADAGHQPSFMSLSSYKDPANNAYRERVNSFDDYPPSNPQYSMNSQPQFEDRRSSSYSQANSYEELSYQKGAKRYNCRFRESHNCEKTFTTSGHASRHSKIHTAEKGVKCEFEGCPKKFTRSDNMKQHLETHYKERSRSSGIKPPVLSREAGIKKSRRAATSRPSSRNSHGPEMSPMSPTMHSAHRFPVAEHSAHPAATRNPYVSVDMHGSLQDSLLSRPIAAARPESSSNAGLDTLAFAVEFQAHNESQSRSQY